MSTDPTFSTFKLYKLMVEEVRDARRARRELSNVVMSLNLAGVGALGLLAREDGGHLNPALFFWCAFALALTCVIWRTSNAYYTHMLAAKYTTIYELEDQLGVHPIRDEWNSLHGKRALMKWFSLERFMPILLSLATPCSSPSNPAASILRCLSTRRAITCPLCFGAFKSTKHT